MAYNIPENKKLITPDSEHLQYMGRIDFDDAKRPVFAWPASCVETVFTGTSVGVVFNNIRMQDYTSLGFIIDGVQGKIELRGETMQHSRRHWNGEVTELPDNGEAYEDSLYMLAEGLEDKEHTLKIFKRLAAAHYVELVGIVVDEGAVLRNPAKKYDYKLEVYGDSVSAGEVTEAIWFEGQCDPAHHSQYDNSHFSYASMLSRKLNAELHLMGQGGIALFDGTGYFCADQLTGMESCYDKIEYSPYKPTKQWDFSRFTPDAVIVAIGQNDHNPEPERIKEPEYRRKWKDAYIAMLNTLRDNHKGAKFVLILTVLGHDKTWDDLLEEVVQEMGTPDVTHFMFRRTGSGTNGHPRATEQEEMAQELYEYMKSSVLR